MLMRINETLVQRTFENEFNGVHYKELVLNLFNRFDFSKELTLKHQFNDAERQALNDFTYFGTYEDAEKKCLDVLTVELKSSSKVERARSLQRNLIGKYLKTNLKDSALVAFYSKDNPDWRLSFVKMDYRLDKKGVKVEIGTPPKRYSFLVGKTEPSHTAQKQLLPLLDDRKAPTLDEIEKSFSIEKVTKEFYTEIAKKFTELVGGERKIGSKKIVEAGQLKYPKPSDTLRKEFAVRVIGRLMFCWFLKKKKSEGGVPLIPNVLLSSDAIMQYPDYYHSLLEPLFFQVLNTSVEKRNKNVKHRFWNDVPFLNGGLFEPHLYDYYEVYYESGLSKYINTLKVPDSWFLDLFKIFEIYNFTIDESTSIDIDISVDPEMLGRIFENLLAEINPETGETARKSTGSYYTPRPIVEYMVDESLKQYLLSQIPTLAKGGEGGFLDENKLSRLLSYGDYEIDLSEPEKDSIIDALDRAKIIDPACGSGAFPMGILHKMLLILQKIDPESKQWLSKKLARIDNEILRKELEKKLKTENWDYVHKLGIIQNSIYGVDIQPIAVEISKLRFFLSLIVDEQIDDDKPNRGVVPLPNLEFKFVAANSLIGLPKAEGGLAESHKDIERLKDLRDAYFTSYGDEKRNIEEQFKETQRRMFLHALNWQATASKTYKLSEWNPFSDEAASWFDPEWMFGVRDDFDIVIANPPYVRIQIMRESAAIEAKYLKENYIAARKGNYDIYVVFLELGMRLLNKMGELAFILPHKFFNTQYGQPIRELLSKGQQLSQIVHFGEHQVFQGATNYTCLLFLKKSGIDHCRFIKVEDLESWFNTCKGIEGIISASQITAADWNFVVGKDSILFERLSKMPVKLGDIADIFVGLQTSADDVFIMDLIEATPKTFRLRSKSLNTEWLFEKDLLFPIVSGTDVNRYAPLPYRQYILFPYNVKNSSAVLIDFKTTITENYPRIAAYLKENKKRLEDRERGKFKGIDWYRFGRNQNLGIQGQVKLCVPRLVEKLYAAYDADGSHYLDNVDVGGITLKEGYHKQGLKYLLALLNSRLLQWYFPFISAPFRGGWLSANRQFLSLLPIRIIDRFNQTDKALHDDIMRLVDQILAAKQKNPNTDTSTLERQIDKMVYELYDLTPKEIKVVEGRG